jgi:hypothetical protein
MPDVSLRFAASFLPETFLICSLYSYNFALGRYSLMPGLFVYAIYCTEPQPTWLELVNPFF